ncbi:MAG: nickel pincer cofactor biosynthesis protein LarC, partial [Methanobacteriaceae archaeon]|nr:nickel pincer cofactor biosynthesis protein LarC [Methanobacteriaceae archaeon]
ATYVEVKKASMPYLRYPEFLEKIEAINHPLIDDGIISFSRRVFHTIAEAEAKIHGESLDDIHFHEVGASDAVADVFGAAFAYFSLGLDKEKVYSLPVALGGGSTISSHGKIPIPAPATLEILKGAPVHGGPAKTELATPTGAALLVNMVDEFKNFLPPIRVVEIGYGAGKMDQEFPNILRIMKGQRSLEEDKIVLFETNLDHLSGEIIGNLFDDLIGEGALDVTITPILMKKNRPGHLLRVISKIEDQENILRRIFKETGTLGIRIFPQVHRTILKREKIPFKVNIKGEWTANFKVAFLDSEIISARIEYDDAKRISSKSGLPLREVMEIAEEQFKREMVNKIEGY